MANGPDRIRQAASKAVALGNTFDLAHESVIEHDIRELSAALPSNDILAIVLNKRIEDALADGEFLCSWYRAIDTFFKDHLCEFAGAAVYKNVTGAMYMHKTPQIWRVGTGLGCGETILINQCGDSHSPHWRGWQVPASGAVIANVYCVNALLWTSMCLKLQGQRLAAKQAPTTPPFPPPPPVEQHTEVHAGKSKAPLERVGKSGGKRSAPLAEDAPRCKSMAKGFKKSGARGSVASDCAEQKGDGHDTAARGSQASHSFTSVKEEADDDDDDEPEDDYDVTTDGAKCDDHHSALDHSAEDDDVTTDGGKGGDHHSALEHSAENDDVETDGGEGGDHHTTLENSVDDDDVTNDRTNEDAKPMSEQQKTNKKKLATAEHK